MDNFTVNYSAYKYKIVDLEIQNWPNCYFNLIFKKELSEAKLQEVKNSIDKWFTKSQSESISGGFHFLEFSEQEDHKKIKFSIDFGNAEPNTLKSLLDLLSGWSNIITVLEIGERARKNNQKYYYETTNFPGVDVTNTPFKVTQIKHWDTDWPLTIYFKESISPATKKELQNTIYDWYSEIKDPEYATEPWIQDVDWQDNKTISWWMSGRSGRTSILFNSLISKLAPYSKIIDELVIGARYPKREEINYPTAK